LPFVSPLIDSTSPAPGLSHETLCVVVPTYNEVDNLPRLVAELRALAIPGVELRVLIVDDASADGTAGVADELAQASGGRIEVLHRTRKLGLGSAYVAGFQQPLAASADLVAQIDADLSHDPAVLAAMAVAIGDADLVIGSRYLRGGGVDAELGWHRRFLSWTANRAVVPALLGLPLTDATSGYRLWRRSALTSIAPALQVRAKGYGFQVEMAFLAHRQRLRIREVPISFHIRSGGDSKMSPRAALATVAEILALRSRRAWTAPAHSVAPARTDAEPGTGASVADRR